MKKLVFFLVFFVLIAPLDASPQQNAVDLYNQGVDALKQGQLDDAIALFSVPYSWTLRTISRTTIEELLTSARDC